MDTQKQNRRNWLKNSALSLAGLAIMPQDTWARAIDIAQKNNSTFIFNTSQSFNEFTPPYFPNEEKLSAILRANENPYGPPPKSAAAFQKEVFSGNDVNTLVERSSFVQLRVLMSPANVILSFIKNKLLINYLHQQSAYDDFVDAFSSYLTS